METLISVLKGTPWWVYPIFFYILYIGIGALKAQTFSVKKLPIAPLAFLIWSIINLVLGYVNAVDLLLWAISICLGVWLGNKMMKKVRVRADHKKMLIRTPGSSFLLIYVLVVFFVKYLFGYLQATLETIGPIFHALNIIVFAGITGIFIGRTYALLQKFSKTKHEKLKKTA